MSDAQHGWMGSSHHAFRWVGVVLWAAGLLGAGSGCRPAPVSLPPGALIVTQVPITDHESGSARDVLEKRYPSGSRVVAIPSPAEPDGVIVLSQGLEAAGGPSLSPDRREVVFTGRRQAGAEWQVYICSVWGGPPREMTDRAGGAMEPDWLPEGRIVFSSPVPLGSGDASGDTSLSPALFTQSVTGGPPSRLTFGVTPATDPTVLGDGRVLFVSSLPGGEVPGESARSLFTVNSDGTEVGPFAGQHDGPATLRRPRELPEGKVVFLAAGLGSPAVAGRIEQVLLSQPFRSRSVAFPQFSEPCRSVEPGPEGTLLATLRSGAAAESYAVYRLSAGANRLGVPIFDDPAWHEVEALSSDVTRRRMNRLPSIDLDRDTGILLCLDGRWTGQGHRENRAPSEAASLVRFYQHRTASDAELLGEARLEPDGSFLVEVPADVAISLELVDDQNGVIRRCRPAFWVRPGENRACIGCHEPHNQAPENLRPMAVAHAPVRLQDPSMELTRGTGSQ